MAINFGQLLASNRLPTLPNVALRVIDLVQADEPDVREIARVIRTDAAIASRILRTGNSALLGLRTKVSTIESAIPQLGLTLVRTLVLGFTLSAFRDVPKNAEAAFETLWRGSLTQAVFAELLAQETPNADPPTYFLAGLLQDVGILSALSVDSRNYLAHVWTECRYPSVFAAEVNYYGFDHTEIAYELCSSWRLPESLCEAVSNHHNHRNDSSPPDLETALQAASLCAEFVANSRNPEPMNRLVQFLSQHYGWSLEKIESVVCTAMLQVHEAAVVFSCNIGEVSTDQIIHDAKKLLADSAIA